MADSTEQRPAVSAEQPVVRIRPSEGWIALDLPELWQYRELFGFLVWRDVKVKYKQAVLGFAWAVLVPFAQMVIFSLIFGRLAGLPSDGLPRPIFYFAALLPWIYFATALTMSSNSLVGGAAFLTKIYVPRLVIPAAPCFAGLVDFAIASVILIAMMFWLEVTPAITMFLLPILLFVAWGTAFGCGLVLSALNVRYRDIRYVLPFLVQMWMYCTVIIPFSAIPQDYGSVRYLYGLNPMASVVEGFRWCIANHRMTVEKEGPLLLGPGDIGDADRLLAKLNAPDEGISAYLRARLSEETRAALTAWSRAGGTAANEVEGLREVALALALEDLNGIISGESIYAPALFENILLKDSTRKLLAGKNDSRASLKLKRMVMTDSNFERLQAKNRLRLNRLLLREAYPRSIADIGTVRLPVEPPWKLLAVGAPVTLLMLVFGLYYFKRTERVFADIV